MIAILGLLILLGLQSTIGQFFNYVNVTSNDLNFTGKDPAYKYDVILKNVHEQIGYKVYLSQLLFQDSIENPYKLKDDQLPQYLGYLLRIKTIIHINFPVGYEHESISRNVKVLYYTAIGKFRFIKSFLYNIFLTTVYFDIEATVSPPIIYRVFKYFFEIIVEKDAVKLVTKKIV